MKCWINLDDIEFIIGESQDPTGCRELYLNSGSIMYTTKDELDKASEIFNTLSDASYHPGYF
jgi:hypothetical protein